MNYIKQRIDRLLRWLVPKVVYGILAFALFVIEEIENEH
jgi:hypothetical protein